jgi:hypothetical protein
MSFDMFQMSNVSLSLFPPNAHTHVVASPVMSTETMRRFLLKKNSLPCHVNVYFYLNHKENIVGKKTGFEVGRAMRHISKRNLTVGFTLAGCLI